MCLLLLFVAAAVPCCVPCALRSVLLARHTANTLNTRIHANYDKQHTNTQRRSANYDVLLRQYNHQFETLKAQMVNSGLDGIGWVEEGWSGSEGIGGVEWDGEKRGWCALCCARVSRSRPD